MSLTHSKEGRSLTATASRRTMPSRRYPQNFAYFIVGFVCSTVLAVISFSVATFFSSVLDTCEPPSVSENSTVPCKGRLVGYYGGWEYREISEEQISKLTHVVFAFVSLNSSGHYSFENEAKEALFLRMKDTAKSAGVKVMFSTGWVTETSSDDAISGEKRRIFLDAIMNFMNTHHLDGVDFNFEWSSDRRRHISSDVTLIKELKTELLKQASARRRTEPYVLSLMIPSTRLETDDEIFLNALLSYVDFCNVFEANYYATWRTGHGTFSRPPLSLKTGSHRESVELNMKYLTCTSQNAGKLNLELRFYGVCWWNAISGTFLPWRRRDTIGWKSKIVSFNENTSLEYDEKTLYTFFDYQEDIETKMKYAMEHGLGGVVIWRIEFDDDRLTLLDTAASMSYCLKNDQEINYECFY